ncbi:MAG: hypothetical protein WBL95_11715 [Microcoleus sp.]
MQLGGVSSPKYRSRFTEALVPALPAVIKAGSNMFRATFQSLFWVSPLGMIVASCSQKEAIGLVASTVVRLPRHRFADRHYTRFPIATEDA